jgi:hypothetical protein
MTLDASELAAYYQCLQLPAEATSAEVDAAYFRLKAEKIQAGDRRQIAPLKAAREAIKAHLNALIANESGESIADSAVAHVVKSIKQPHEPDFVRSLLPLLNEHGLTAQASLRGSTLNLGVDISDTEQTPSQITARVRHLLGELPEGCGLEAVKTIYLYGLIQAKPQWKKSFPPPEPQITADDLNLYSYHNSLSNTIIFPVLLLIGALLNATEPIKLMLFGLHIWIHEFGHATIAWLGGYQATPLPFGWTNIGESQSMFVYFGVLTLLALLFYSGLKEQSRWSMGLAVGLAIAQFYLTWLISEDTFYMLVSFGGIGGEFYLSTLLIVSFYFPLPAYWRWKLLRYPAALCAGFTFLGSFWQWRQIERGLGDIPWGTLFGGADHIGGDMNQLSVVYGWSDLQIIDTYNRIGSFCLIAILSTYIYVLLKEKNYQYVYAMLMRWQIRRS